MATKATLINSAGKKVVVDSGSAQAQSYFSQGYKLMGATPAPATVPVAPATGSGNVAAPVTPANQMPAPKVGPTPAATGGNTLQAYDQKGNVVYVQPGTYNPGISATKPDLNAELNANQDQNINDYNSKTDGGPDTSAATKAMAAIKAEVTPTTNAPATPPKLMDTYNALRTENGITGLEENLTNLQNEEQTIRNTATNRKDYEEQTIRNTATNRKDYAEGKPVALGVISGKQSEVDRQTAKQLTENLAQQSYLSNQLKTKYDIISNIMNFQQKDYENASAAYNTEFNQNISLLQQVRADETASASEENIKLDNARADYAIFVNAIGNGSLDITDLTATQKATLNKLEVQQGLPVGTYELLAPKDGNKTLTSLGTDNNSSGGRSAYFMSVDKKTGVPTVISVPLPGAVTTKASGSGSGTGTEDKQITNFQNDAADFIVKMDSSEMTWATAWAALHAKYPEASSALIDQKLGGGYDESKGGWYGRAATAKSLRK